MPAHKKSPARSSKHAAVHVAFLRGINVGGKNKLPMAALAEIFVEAGCADVRTYIQSGNVVFAASNSSMKRIPRLVSDGVGKGFGFRPVVVVRSARELDDAAANNPFLRTVADTASLHVGFMADLPDERHVAALDPKRSPGDSFKVRDREIYLFLPNGVARSKLTNAYFDSMLKTTSTFRNWRTVLTLLEMTRTTS